MFWKCSESRDFLWSIQRQAHDFATGPFFLEFTFGQANILDRTFGQNVESPSLSEDFSGNAKIEPGLERAATHVMHPRPGCAYHHRDHFDYRVCNFQPIRVGVDLLLEKHGLTS